MDREAPSRVHKVKSGFSIRNTAFFITDDFFFAENRVLKDQLLKMYFTVKIDSYGRILYFYRTCDLSLIQESMLAGQEWGKQIGEKVVNKLKDKGYLKE